MLKTGSFSVIDDRGALFSGIKRKFHTESHSLLDRQHKRRCGVPLPSRLIFCPENIPFKTNKYLFKSMFLQDRHSSAAICRWRKMNFLHSRMAFGAPLDGYRRQAHCLS
jgi:hypothetical protein